MQQPDLDDIYAFAIDLGRKAGQLLLGNVEKRIAGAVDQEFEEKDNAVDIVTQTDEGLSWVESMPSAGWLYGWC